MSTKSIKVLGRLSYPALFTAKKNELNPAAEPKFSTQILFEANDKQTVDVGGQKLPLVQALNAILIEAATEKWGQDRAKWPFVNKGVGADGKPIRGFKNSAIKDQGDKLFQKDGKPRSGFVAGAKYIEPSAKAAPGVVDKSVQPLMDATKAYGGVYALVEINAYAYDNVTQGVNFGLLNVMILGYGEPFGFVRADPSKVFTPMEGATDENAESGGAAAGQTADSLL